MSQAGGLPASQSALPESDFPESTWIPCTEHFECVFECLGHVWAGAEERGDIYEQAMKLGGGSEALLGFVEGTLGAGRPCSGTVYAAARRCVKYFPKSQPWYDDASKCSCSFLSGMSRLWARLHLAYFWAKILNRPAWS